jgi:two-component system response regulator DesR
VTRPVSTPIRVAVIDDHRDFRDRVIGLVNSSADLAVTGEGSSFKDAVSAAADHQPDVLVLTVDEPGDGTAAATAAIRAASPITRVVALALREEPGLILELIEAGVSAYLLTSADGPELAMAIRGAARRDDTVLISVPRESLLGLSQQEDEALSDAEDGDRKLPLPCAESRIPTTTSRSSWVSR